VVVENKPGAIRRVLTVKPLFSGTLFRPNGIAFKDGTLYIAELNKISKVEHIEDKSRQSAQTDRDL
jgi:hypothetical protein